MVLVSVKIEGTHCFTEWSSGPHCPLTPAVRSPGELCKIRYNKGSLEKLHHFTGSEYCKVINDQPLWKGKEKNKFVLPLQFSLLCTVTFACIAVVANLEEKKQNKKKQTKVMQERRVRDAVHHMFHANSSANKKQGANRHPQKDSFW